MITLLIRYDGTSAFGKHVVEISLISQIHLTLRMPAFLHMVCIICPRESETP